MFPRAHHGDAMAMRLMRKVDFFLQKHKLSLNQGKNLEIFPKRKENCFQHGLILRNSRPSENTL